MQSAGCSKGGDGKSLGQAGRADDYQEAGPSTSSGRRADDDVPHVVIDLYSDIEDSSDEDTPKVEPAFELEKVDQLQKSVKLYQGEVDVLKTKYLNMKGAFIEFRGHIANEAQKARASQAQARTIIANQRSYINYLRSENMIFSYHKVNYGIQHAKWLAMKQQRDVANNQIQVLTNSNNRKEEVIEILRRNINDLTENSEKLKIKIKKLGKQNLENKQLKRSVSYGAMKQRRLTMKLNDSKKQIMELKMRLKGLKGLQG